MKLSELIASLLAPRVVGPLDVDIAGLVYDSRKVQPGFAFVAIQGTHVDGHDFISSALAAGAAAIVYDNETVFDLIEPGSATFVRVPNARAALSPLAAAWYGYPARRLAVAGVTGSKGKTTTATLLAHILEQPAHSSALITTVDFKIGSRWWNNLTRQTTPEALEIQQLLRSAVDSGCDSAVVEASSHALSPQWNRVGDCAFDLAILTNITHEHLDYHGSFEQYRHDKARLFELLFVDKPGRPKTAVINGDDPNAEFFIAAAGWAQVLTYGLDTTSADVTAEQLDMTRDGVRYSARTPWGTLDVELNIPGRFNVLNSLAALTAGLALGVDGAACVAALRAIGGVNGRMERIELGQPFTVLVDYAHNPDSFEQVLGMMRPLTAGKLIAVFGSAGERDREKRALQGSIAGRYCELTIVTDEDPRDEDPQAILQEIAAGVRSVGRRDGLGLLLIADRSLAVREALRRAKPGDIVLLLGKGHESSILYEHGRKLPWSERGEAERALRELGYGY